MKRIVIRVALTGWITLVAFTFIKCTSAIAESDLVDDHKVALVADAVKKKVPNINGSKGNNQIDLLNF